MVRRYDNSARALAAQQTRMRIMRAAGEAFDAHGYAATTLNDVAGRAGVSVETVKKAFGTKPHLLQAWFDGLVAGEENVPVAEKRHLAALSSAPSLPDRTWLAADALARTHRRVARAYLVVAAAAHADPTIARWWEQERQRRMQDVRTITSLVLGDHEPSRPMDELHAELYALSEPHLYLVLTHEQGWSDQQYATWFLRVALGAMTATPESQTAHEGEPS